MDFIAVPFQGIEFLVFQLISNHKGNFSLHFARIDHTPMIVWMTNKFDWFYTQEMVSRSISGYSAITTVEYAANVNNYLYGYGLPELRLYLFINPKVSEIFILFWEP